MSIFTEAAERIEQNKRTLRHYLKSHHIDYLAHFGSIVECELLIQQFTKEGNKDMLLRQMKIKNILERRFYESCLKNEKKIT